MSDEMGLVARLNDLISSDDHERLCQGREYSCTCGYDARKDAALAEAAAAIERLVAERDRLADALKPFRLLANCTDSEPDGASVIVNVNRARDARKALGDT